MYGQRLEKEKVLDNFRRSEIFMYIRENPGARQCDIKRKFRVGGTITAYHLNILEKYEFIRSVKDENGVPHYFYNVWTAEWDQQSPLPVCPSKHRAVAIT